jgi:hypothetical protein
MVLLAICWAIPRTSLCLLVTTTSFAYWHTLRHQENPGRQLEMALQAEPRVSTAMGVVITEPEPLPYVSRKRSGTFIFSSNGSRWARR